MAQGCRGESRTAMEKCRLGMGMENHHSLGETRLGRRDSMAVASRGRAGVAVGCLDRALVLGSEMYGSSDWGRDESAADWGWGVGGCV